MKGRRADRQENFIGIASNQSSPVRSMGCFKDDTEVMMANGTHLPIRSVCSGDRVITINLSTLNKEQVTIESLIETQHQVLYQLTFENHSRSIKYDYIPTFNLH